MVVAAVVVLAAAVAAVAVAVLVLAAGRGPGGNEPLMSPKAEDRGKHFQPGSCVHTCGVLGLRVSGSGVWG